MDGNAVAQKLEANPSKGLEQKMLGTCESIAGIPVTAEMLINTQVLSGGRDMATCAV